MTRWRDGGGTTRGVPSSQDPHTSGITKASHTAKGPARLRIPPELLRPEAGTMTLKEWLEWEASEGGDPTSI